MKIKGVEKRAFNFEFRSEGDDEGGAQTITGYGALFDSLSENLGGFREKIAPGAFDGVMDNDVRALINHDSNLILARTGSKTLSLDVDSAGLRYSFELPDVSYARDLAVSIARGDISQSSFAFRVEEDRWEEDEDGRIIRTILSFRELYDVSPVTYPGYADTTVAVRGLDAFNADRVSESTKLAAERREREFTLRNITS